MRGLLLDRSAQPIFNRSPNPSFQGSGGVGISALGSNAPANRTFKPGYLGGVHQALTDTLTADGQLGKRWIHNDPLYSGDVVRFAFWITVSQAGTAYPYIEYNSGGGYAGPGVNLQANVPTRIVGYAVSPGYVTSLRTTGFLSNTFPSGTVLRLEASMVTINQPLPEVHCDGNTPGWKWLGSVGGASMGWPYTLESLAGKPRWNTEFPTLGTTLPGVFEAHTSFSYGDILTSGQRGWLASEPEPSTGRRWEALNVSTNSRDPRIRLQGGPFQTSVFSGTNTAPPASLIGGWWGSTGEIGIRGYNYSGSDSVAPARTEQMPVPGYRLRSGVRDNSTGSGVSMARQIVYDRLLSSTERNAVARWIANRYGLALA